MALAIGTRIGHYEVLSALGAGGMGEVYRARDHKLNRDVALKVVNASAIDPDQLQRLVREAHSLAALNHPHIAQIYGLEDSTDTRALVMELVDGEDLSTRIARGPMPLDEALEIARQIADALEVAHDVGIVHRDLKPANVRVRGDGTVKVLDFGLAKALDPATGTRQPASAAPANSPTFTSPAMTAAGVILGTAAYMSPEQARGKAVDKRTDIWAFGVVLYEMLTGKPAFAGETVTDLLAAIVTREPDWSRLPSTVPPRVEHLMRRCLDRDPRTRLRDIGEARVELARGEWDEQRSIAQAPTTRSAIARIAPWAVALAAVAAAVAIWVGRPHTEAPVRKLELALPADGAGFALSPDGRQVAYRSHGAIVVNDFTRFESRDLVTSTPDQHRLVFWSADGRFIAYSDADGKLWTIPVAGGTPRLVCTIPETRQLMGGAWLQSDVIVLAVWRGSVYRVAASGGQPTAVLTIDPAKEMDIHEVVPLPDGRVLVTTHLLKAGIDDYQVDLIGIEPPASRETVFGSGFWPVGFAASGHILMRRVDVNRGLWAFPYTGRWPLTIDKAFLVAPGAMSASVSADGSALYSMESSASRMHDLAWLDRTGQVVGQIGAPKLELNNPALSPDGNLVAYSARVGDNVDVWVRDLRTDAQVRVTSEADDQGLPSWFPGGNRLLYSEAGGMTNRIAARNSDGSGSRQELGAGLDPSISPDGKHVVFSLDERGAIHLRVADLTADAALGEPHKAIAATPEPEARQGRVSPDGQLLAFTERTYSGLPEVIVTRFPSGEGRWPISNGGGRSPVWSRSGELFFIGGATAGPKDMMATSVSKGQKVTIGSAIKLFAIPEDLAAGPNGPTFDVTADGKRLLMVRSRGATLTTQRWVLVQNWLAEFQR